MRRSLGLIFFFSIFATQVVGAENRFDVERAATLYFTSGHGAAAMAHLSRKEHAACAREAASLADEKAHAPQARFLLAYCRWKAGLPGASAVFDELVESYPLLADYARLYAADALLLSGAFDEAMKRARSVGPDSVLRPEAELTIANALSKSERPSEAANAYAHYLSAYPSSWRAGEVRGLWANALDVAKRGDEATLAWRQCYVENPVTLGPKAESHFDVSTLSADELARRAEALFDAMKNKDSELAWGKVLDAKDHTAAHACRARYNLAQSVWKQRDRARAAPLFEIAVAACVTAKNEDLSAKSLYQAGRSHGSRAEKDKAAGETAIALYARLMRDFSSHSYADDAAFRRADLLDTLGRKEESAAAMAAIPTQFPSGDQRGEALFQLAFRAFELGDAASAKTWLELELSTLPREEGWWEAGRTLYWLARANDVLHNGLAARGFYERALKEYPLSYYALMAANRLLAASPIEAEHLLATLSFDGKSATPALIDDRPLFHSEGFRRGLELLKLGLGAEARREFTQAGLSIPRRGTARPTDRELAWVGSALFEAAHDYPASHAYGRYVDTEYARAWPSGDIETKWRLSFPRAYESLVEKSVERTGQPAALEFAIMREESAFDPNLESFANAVGLTQLTAPPAARYAEGLAHDAQALRDPATNIAIGARELGALYSLFRKNAPLAIAGYNAGEGAVTRWLKKPENKDRALDEFIERIPYDETRGYTKRVLGTYFAYAWLDRKGGSPTARVPRVDFTLPQGKN